MKTKRKTETVDVFNSQRVKLLPVHRKRVVSNMSTIAVSLKK